MKKWFFVLLLANGVFFALMLLKGSDWGGQMTYEQIPLQEKKIRLLDASKNEPVRTPEMPIPEFVPVSPTSASALQLSMNMSVPPVSGQGASICLEWGDFSGTDLARATAVLTELQLGEKLSQREVEQDTGYWVYIPPLKSKGAVNKKIGELRDMGVKEYFVVSNAGRWRNAISLGVFKTREAAQNLLNQLRAKGVRSAQIGERASKLRTTRYILSGISSETAAKLSGMQKDFSGSELENVPCALTRQDEIGKMPRSSR